jgi:hypothetical protein
MNFNLTTKVLTFTAAGPVGTSGYVNITLKKAPEFNPQNVVVRLDNETIPYSFASVDENTWLLTINYAHSTHNVIVSLGGNTVIPEMPSVAFLIMFFRLHLSQPFS